MISHIHTHTPTCVLSLSVRRWREEKTGTMRLRRSARADHQGVLGVNRVYRYKYVSDDQPPLSSPPRLLPPPCSPPPSSPLYLPVPEILMRFARWRRRDRGRTSAGQSAGMLGPFGLTLINHRKQLHLPLRSAGSTSAWACVIKCGRHRVNRRGAPHTDLEFNTSFLKLQSVALVKKC